MSHTETLLSFDNVSFGYDDKKPLLDSVNFNVRQGSKITLMGQNGAGKSTIFQLINRSLKPKSGVVNTVPKLTVATSHQVMKPGDRELTVLEFFQKQFKEKRHDLPKYIDQVLEVVNLKAPHDRIVKSFSGGQQARLLLAAALIQDPDLLLLDEPTNNLDPAGIEHLTQFLINYGKTVMVISHDADFLNSFTQGVLYLDVFTHKVEQYVGNYYDAVAAIEARREKENMKNAQMAKGILKNKEQANTFAHKGGKLRLVAKKMRDKAEEMEAAMVDVRREDKTIRDFEIPVQADLSGELMKLTSVKVIKHHQPTILKVDMSLRKKEHLLLSGPNGIGKSTLLEALASGKAEGAFIKPEVRIGYYRQDFSTLNFENTVREELLQAMKKSGQEVKEEKMRMTAAGFLITKEWINAKIGTLSEGQKGLVALTSLVLMEPGLLILDEPTNHINFRHLPVIAEALDKYEGAMILVSHIPEFVWQIRIDHTLELDR
ncbi:ABC-F family ATP-binding cassette domain-containing protein [Candidatus Peregrinibacteria bacterium]|nr:MAG: ABC-F family ATP-binding cassette domain-containing protein [Candidatus Peregrinibacteria bacterium]